MAMWTVWPMGSATAYLLALALALPLVAALSHAASSLPGQLDDSIPMPVSRRHGYYRLGLWVVGPALAMFCVWRFGPALATGAAIVYVLVLLTLAWIDAETGFLPDLLTLPLLWLGLLVNLDGTFTLLSHAVVGAAAGYMVLWSLCGVFLLISGRQGMGHGDFKLLAALGAWLGWAVLPWILLIACGLALCVALFRRIKGGLAAGEAFSFGPFLAFAGIFMLFFLY